VLVCIVIVIAAGGTACDQAANSITDNGSDRETQSVNSQRETLDTESQEIKRRNPMTTETIEQELQRARILLSTAKEPLQEVAPEIPPESIGALAGMGFEVKDPDVRLSIYVFQYQNQHAAAVEKLRANVSQEGTRILHASNGSLLFFGHTRIDGSNGIDAKFRLGGLVGAFAGEE
jgi:hypothetical protein